MADIFTKLGIYIAAPSDSSGAPRKPVPQDFQVWMTEVERLIQGLIAGAGGDIDLPDLIYKFTVTGGTPNNIIATPNATPPNAPGEALLTIETFQPNTGNVTINGKSLKTNSGNEIAAGGLVPGIWMFLDNGSEYRLVSDQASQAILAAVENALFASQAAQQAAEDARDAAAGFASDIISQGNVPIYSTLAGITGLEIPAHITAIRVNGRHSVGDGDGGLYVDGDNGSTDTVDSADGRTWYRVRDVLASRVVHTPSINSLIPNTLQVIADGLPISPKMFGAVGQNAVKDTPALNDMLAFSSEYDNNASRYIVMDGGGWRYHLNKEITATSLATHYGKKRFTNMQLVPVSGFDGQYILDLSKIATHSRFKVGDIQIDNMHIQGGDASGNSLIDGWIKLDGTHGIRIHDNSFSRNNRVGILDLTPGAATEVYIYNNRLLGGVAAQSIDPTGIHLNGYDSKIFDNVINAQQVGIRCERGGNTITGNHIYNEDILSRSGFGSAIQMRDVDGYSRNFIIEGNYIDSMPMRLYRPSLGSVVGNKFLLPNKSLWGSKHASFMEIANGTGQQHYVDDMLITGNKFFCNGGGEVSTIGYVGSAIEFRNSNIMKDNSFRNSTKVGTVVSQLVEVSNQSSVVVSVSGKGIGFTIHETAVSCIAQGNAQVENIARSGTNFTINFSAAFTGKVVLTTTTNKDGVWC